MIDMLFLTRLKVLLKRKSTLFWILLFPILLSTAEYFAFGRFIHSTPIDTITIGVVEEKTPVLLKTIFEEAKIEEERNLYSVKVYSSIDAASNALQLGEIKHFVYENDSDVKVVAKRNGTELSITSTIIEQAKIIETTILAAYEKYYYELSLGHTPDEVDENLIIKNLLEEVSYFKDKSTNKTATFYTFYFYSLMAMSCLYAALFGVSIIQDVRADRSSLGIRISSSVVSKGKLMLSYFAASCVLQIISATVLCLYFVYGLKISLGGNIGLILLTLILGGFSGITIGMLIGAFVKGGEAKAQGIVTAVTLSLSCLSGLMAVDVKHLVDKYLPFINYVNPASLISNSLYALYYYNTYTNYIIYSVILACFSILAVGIVIYKMRGEKYASL
ncbi:MAG: ABC transporter permease [Anaeroplasmataceae bacterium]|nr:ABC transporter permease [Anaeroplasmataceae bacterium]